VIDETTTKVNVKPPAEPNASKTNNASAPITNMQWVSRTIGEKERVSHHVQENNELLQHAEKHFQVARSLERSDGDVISVGEIWNTVACPNGQYLVCGILKQKDKEDHQLVLCYNIGNKRMSKQKHSNLKGRLRVPTTPLDLGAIDEAMLAYSERKPISGEETDNLDDKIIKAFAKAGEQW
jgi:hypothetical protein